MEEHKGEYPEKEHSETEKELTEKIRENPWIFSTIILGLLAIVLLVNSSGLTGNVIGKEKAEEKFLDYLKNLGAETESIEVTNISSKSGMYEISFDYKGEPYPIPLYLTQDGKFAGNLNSLVQTTNSAINTPNQEISKSDKPSVELFVMSLCPYGNKAENTIIPVYNLLKDKVEWNIHYIVSADGDTIKSLHGQPEVDQDIREICVLKEYGIDKFWKFTAYANQNCGSDGKCWKDAVKEYGLDLNKLRSCFENQGIDLMKDEAEISGEAKANGSPTLFINKVKSDSVYQYGDSEVYKQAICSAFNNPPKECSTELSVSTDTSSGGSCNS